MEDWLTIENGSGQGNGGFVIKAETNKLRKDREKTISVSGTGVSTPRTVKVTQKKALAYVKMLSGVDGVIQVGKEGGAYEIRCETNAQGLQLKMWGENIANLSTGNGRMHFFNKYGAPYTDDSKTPQDESIWHDGIASSVVVRPTKYTLSIPVPQREWDKSDFTAAQGGDLGLIQVYEAYFNLDIPANLATAEQRLRVEISCIGEDVNASTKIASVELRQAYSTASFELYEDEAHSLVVNEVTLDAEGGSKSIYVGGNTPWEATIVTTE